MPFYTQALHTRKQMFLTEKMAVADTMPTNSTKDGSLTGAKTELSVFVQQCLTVY